MSERRRVVVTGAAGFTGHHVVVQAVRHGLDVRATDLTSGRYGALFDALGVEFVACDLTRPGDGLSRLLDGAHAVLHVAGIHNYSAPRRLLRAVNVGAVERLCRIALGSGVERVVHLSSVGVYGYGWRSGRPVREDDDKLTPPLNDYNVTKWEGEQALWRSVREDGLRAVVLRPAAIYGPGAEYGLANVFRHVHESRKRRRILMVGRGERVEAFIHVEDVARAMLHALATDSMLSEAYNVSDDSRITTAELFRMVSRELLGEEKPFLHVPLSVLGPVARASQMVARVLKTTPPLEKETLEYLSFDRIWDNDKLKATGFELRHPQVETGLPETLRWYRDHGWLPA